MLRDRVKICATAVLIPLGILLSVQYVYAHDNAEVDYGPGMMGGQYGPGMMGGQYGPGMMGGQYGPGMMGGQYGPGMMGGQYGPGMMGGQYGPGMMGGQYGPGMMGGQYGPGMMGIMSMLNLSERQQRGVIDVQDKLRTQHWQLMGSMMQQQALLRDALSVDKPDPAEVGAIYGEIFDLQRQMIEARITGENEIKSLLNDEQLSQLKGRNRQQNRFRNYDEPRRPGSNGEMMQRTR